MRPSRKTDSGFATVEYVLLTGLLLGALSLPFGDSHKSAIDRLLDAIKTEHAGYLYVASLPTLPQLQGGQGHVPGGNGNGNGAGGDPAQPGNNNGGGNPNGNGGGQPGGGPGGGGSGTPGGGGNGNGDGGGTPSGGNTGGTSGGGGSGNGGTGNSSGGSSGNGSDSGSGNDSSSSGSPGWKGKVLAAAAIGYVACEFAPEADPHLRKEDYRAWVASVHAYSDDGAGFAGVGIKYPKPQDGFSASLYKVNVKVKGKDSYEYILAFRGTEPKSLDDWEADGEQAIFGKTSQYEQAVDLANRVKNRLAILHPGIQLIYAGHSLGGGLATAAAHATHDRAITFNAAGLNDEYKKGKAGEIRAHYIRGEILRSVQTLPGLPQAEGKPIVHSGPSCTTGPARRHFVCNFADDFKPFGPTPPECASGDADQSGLKTFVPEPPPTPSQTFADAASGSETPPPQSMPIRQPTINGSTP